MLAGTTTVRYPALERDEMMLALARPVRHLIGIDYLTNVAFRTPPG